MVMDRVKVRFMNRVKVRFMNRVRVRVMNKVMNKLMIKVVKQGYDRLFIQLFNKVCFLIHCMCFNLLKEEVPIKYVRMPQIVCF